MTENEKNTKILIESIKAFTETPELLENFESYLNRFFDIWYEKYANTGENLVSEFKFFSQI